MANEFIATGEVARRLLISRSHLQKLFPVLPYLYVTRRETRLFPASYIDAYAKTLAGEWATVSTARAFAKTEMARGLIEESREWIERALTDQKFFTPVEVAALLCVSRMTITEWHQAGVLKIIRVPYKRMEIIHIDSQELRKAVEWKLPQK